MTSRRQFLARSALLVTLPPTTGAIRTLPGVAPGIVRQPKYDLVIRGGMVHDGTGAPGRVADVAVRGDRIVAVGASLRGRVEVDARGRAVAPGFVDIHSHGDSALAADPRARSAVTQGITTIVAGADGSSPATGSAARPFAAALDRWTELRPAVNVAAMVGLGSIRGEVVGDRDRRATADEIERMTAMVASAVADGACGASSGLEYTPGAFANVEELVALCRPLAARRLVYATHMRNEDDRLLEAIDESIAVAEGAKCGLQISHLKTQGPRNWSKLDTVFARIDAARARGIDVAFDRYPYLAYSTGLTNLFPVWSRDGGIDAFLARLQEPAVAARIERETLAKVELIGGWDNVQIASVSAAADRAAEGRRLGRHAAAVGESPYTTATALLVRSRGNVGMAGFAMSEANLERILAHPLGMVCTDGGAFAIDGPTRRGSPHPRGIGSFPRVLARYVRERGTLTLSAAVHKMSGLPASRVGLRDRGTLREGAAADIVVFDPARVADRATFESPFQYATGIEHVLVNGAFAVRDGAPDDSAGGRGRGLRSGGRD